MKILFITQIYPINPKKKSNDKRLALHYYVREWIKAHKVEVIRLHNFPVWYAWIFPLLGYPKQYTIDGVTVSNRLVIKYTKLRRDYRSVRTFAKEFTPDITIAHIPDSLMAAHDLFKKFSIPYVAGIQKTDYLKSGLKNEGVISPLFQELLETSVMVAFWSAFLKNEFTRALPSIAEKSIDMPGGLTADWVSSMPNKRAWSSEQWNIGTVARLVEQKRLPVLLKSLSRFPGWKTYHLIGDGNEKQNLISLSKDLKIGERVIFHGHLEVNEIVEILDHCHIMVLLSTNETFGLVYLEAMARGCLVIGTKGEGIEGVIEHEKNGFLCESSSEALENLLRHIKSLPKERLKEISKAARDTALRYQNKDLAKDYLVQLERQTSD